MPRGVRKIVDQSANPFEGMIRQMVKDEVQNVMAEQKPTVAMSLEAVNTVKGVVLDVLRGLVGSGPVAADAPKRRGRKPGTVLVKKGNHRGRKPGSKNKPKEGAIATPAAPAPAAEAPKKRGRKPGTPGAKRGRKPKAATEGG